MYKHQSIGRLDHLDGLRAVAILWVAIYHYAYFWTSAGKGTALLPYDAALAWIPMANVGYLGVYLFFIVSGFVISLSLQRSDTVLQFVINRLIRLWPTLVFCGSITFIATTAFGPPELVRSTLEYLISLTFVPPPHVGKAIGVDGLEWLDGAYWSLWTEVRFYIIAACLYFLARHRFLLLWAVFAIGCSAIHIAALRNGGTADALSRLLFAEYQPYFTVGIALASLRFGQNRMAPIVLLIFGVIQAVAYQTFSTDGMSQSLAIGLIVVFGLAIPVMLARVNVPVLSSSLMVSIGVASYAYYLLHQNAGMALLTWLTDGKATGSIALMLATQAGLIGLSIWLTRVIEEPIRKRLRSLV